MQISPRFGARGVLGAIGMALSMASATFIVAKSPWDDARNLGYIRDRHKGKRRRDPNRWR